MLAGRVARSSSDMVPRVTVATLWIVCTQCTCSHSVHSARAPLPCCTSCPLLTLLCMQLDLKDVSYMLYVAASRFRTGHGLSMLHSVPSIIRAYACEASRSPATNDSTHGLLGCTTLRCIERACPTTKTTRCQASSAHTPAKLLTIQCMGYSAAQRHGASSGRARQRRLIPPSNSNDHTGKHTIRALQLLRRRACHAHRAVVGARRHLCCPC